MELCIVKNGTKISKRKKSFYIDDMERELQLSAEKIDSIILEGEVSLTSGAIRLATENEIPIVICDKYGNVIGQFFSSISNRNGKLRKNQYQFFASEKGLELAKSWLIDKISKQKEHIDTLLKRRKRNLDQVSNFDIYIKKIQQIKKYNPKARMIIMGYEGMASRLYFKIISELLEEKWRFYNREHRKAKEPYNIVLNYLFGILYRKLESIFLYEGFDLTVGIIHFEGNKKLPLVYDYIEKYRYLAYDTVFDLFHKKIIKNDFFEIENESLIMSKRGKYEVSLYFNELLEKKEIYSKNKFSKEDIIKYEIKKIKKEIMEMVV
nr:CRISPR-associated endonuclease Cas1 [Fusobacterium gastrosuis]